MKNFTFNRLQAFDSYGIEYSNQKHDGAYIKFMADDDSIMPNKWSSSDFAICDGKYDADANRCSMLAPFDSPMNIMIDIVVGGGVDPISKWCGAGVSQSDYNILDRDDGVELEISRIAVYALTFDECQL